MRLRVRTPCPEARAARHNPVTRVEVVVARGGGAAGEDAESAFVAGDGGGLRGGECGCEAGGGGVDALYLIDVGGVYGGREGSEGD